MKLFLLFFLPFVFSLFGAPLKLAIVGVPEFVDLTIAELSDDDGLELIERSAISQVLKEHSFSEMRLSGSELCKLFPHADVFAVIAEKSMRTFNAKNGFCLSDSEHGGAAKKMVGDIRLAMAKTAQDEPLLLSKLAYRDAGVARRLQKRLPEVVADIERMLLADQNIQLLERDRLEMVATERGLSGATFQLPASTLLIAFEFEPGENGGMVNLLIQVHDLTQRKVAEESIKDLFNHPNHIRRGVDALRKKLLQGARQKGNYH